MVDSIIDLNFCRMWLVDEISSSLRHKSARGEGTFVPQLGTFCYIVVQFSLHPRRNIAVEYYFRFSTAHRTKSLQSTVYQSIYPSAVFAKHRTNTAQHRTNSYRKEISKFRIGNQSAVLCGVVRCPRQHRTTITHCIIAIYRVLVRCAVDFAIYVKK